jgi:hypothetical protein
MASITHTQVRTLTEAGGSVADTVTASAVIPMELFLYKTADDTFSHIPTLAEIYAYPVGKQAALSAGKSFYRSATCTRVFPVIADAQTWAAQVPASFKRLAVEWTAALPFVGTTNETILG